MLREDKGGSGMIGSFDKDEGKKEQINNTSTLLYCTLELKREVHKHRLRISRVWKDPAWRNGLADVFSNLIKHQRKRLTVLVKRRVEEY